MAPVRLALVLLCALAAPVQAALPAPELLPAALAAVPGADLVFFDEARPGQPTRVLAAMRTRATLAGLRAAMLDPGAYQRAVPAFRRAEVVERHGAEVKVAWELEVPLWNLEGTLWLRPVTGGVDLELAGGDFAPGLFRLRARPVPGGVLAWVDAHANMRDANWATRRLVDRSPLAEPALSAAAAWVLLRALVLEAERVGPGLDPRRRHPQAAPSPPPPGALDGAPLARLARDTLPPGLTTAAVRTRPDGRLDRVEVAATMRYGADAVRKAVAEPQRWRALPGWHQVKVRPGPPPTSLWEIDSRFPFVDFDAVWAVQPGPPLRGQVIDGDAHGAVLGWDVVEGKALHTSLAVFSLHPRLETAGYVPRKFIRAEPLLEHGMSLGLAYVDAVSLVRALQGKQ